MLDSADRKILRALEDNPRLPTRDIAVASGLTLAQATSRIRRIEKRQLAHIVAVLNMGLMGYKTANIFATVRGRPAHDVAKDLAKLRDVSWLASAVGSDSDLIGSIRYREEGALAELLRESVSPIAGLSTLRVNTVLETLRFSGRHISFVPPEPDEELDVERIAADLKETIGHVVADPLDLSLIAELLCDGRSSSRELARRYQLSHGTIGNRIKALEARRVFELQTLIDPAAVGLNCFAYVEIRVEAGHLGRVISELKTKSWFPYLSLTTGESNLGGLILARDMREASRLKSVELLSVEGVRSVEMSILTGNHTVDAAFGYFLDG